MNLLYRAPASVNGSERRTIEELKKLGHFDEICFMNVKINETWLG